MTVRLTTLNLVNATLTSTLNINGVTSSFSVTTAGVANTFIITAVANPATGGTVSCTPNPVPEGGNATCTATPNTGYTFSGWSGDCTGIGICTLTNVTDAKSLSARFTAAAQKTYKGPTATGTGNAIATVSGGGDTCGFSDARFVPLSSVATAPPAGYSFPHGLFQFTLTQCTVGSTLCAGLSKRRRFG